MAVVINHRVKRGAGRKRDWECAICGMKNGRLIEAKWVMEGGKPICSVCFGLGRVYNKDNGKDVDSTTNPE